MSAQPEKQLTDKIIKALRSEGAFVQKIHGGTFQARGLPDVILCYRSHFIGLEVKVPGKEKTVSLLQRKKLWDIYNAGGVGYMVTSVEEALSVIEEVRSHLRRKPNVKPPEST
jgi:hypothetical protein